MPLDLVIRNGLIVDGTGAPGHHGDVGIREGRIVSVGTVSESATESLDAEGHVVAPGFIDGHTHMDVQVNWDPIGTSSCWHGVTSVLMGNCGFGLAPARKQDRDRVIENIERAEDIAAAAVEAGVEWKWETFADYMDAIDSGPLGINYATLVGHSALRVWAMGDRAFEEEATGSDILAMKAELGAALEAGAFGFSTSRTGNHMRPNGRPVASRLASWDELCQLVFALQGSDALCQLAHEDAIGSHDAVEQSEYCSRFMKLAEESGVKMTWGAVNEDPEYLRSSLRLLDAPTSAHLVGQVVTKEVALMQSFKAHMPFDVLPEWMEMRNQPLAGQRELLRDPQMRAHLVKAAHEGNYGVAVSNEGRAPDYEWFRIMDNPLGPHPSVASIARSRGVDPVELIIDLALESDFNQFFIQVFGNRDLDDVLVAMRNPRSIVPFSDSGAHVSWILDAAAPTHLLGYWVRERGEFSLEEGVRMLSHDPAVALGFVDRGVVAEGAIGDLAIFDPETVSPAMPTVDSDLPGGATRLKQNALGVLATIVGGQVLTKNGEHTGALPGCVLRRKGSTISQLETTG